MRAFLISALCALAYAKPQYNYPAPSIPSRPSVPTGGYGAPSGGGQISVGFGGGAGGGSVGFGGGAGGGSASFAGNRIYLGGGGAAAGGGASSASFGGGGAFAGAGASAGAFATGGGGTLVQKHIYVHVAPPEPEEVRQQRPIPAGQSTKHYKIIFIKAPSYDYQQQQILQAQAQNEEKTLVYVLVKKPDEVADITLPTAAPTAPSKPEVYFIRYKARSEATASASATSSASGTGHLIGGGTGGGASLNIGSSDTSVSVGRPAPSYGPPGVSGPY